MGYKLIIDFPSNDVFGDFYKRLSSMYDLIYDNECIYIWGDGLTEDMIKEILKDCELPSYVIKKINIEDYKSEMTFVNVWVGEHYCAELQKKFDEEHQEELQNMSKNIDKILQNIEKIKK